MIYRVALGFGLRGVNAATLPKHVGDASPLPLDKEFTIFFTLYEKLDVIIVRREGGVRARLGEKVC